MNSYLNNIDQLVQFTHIFKDQGAALLQKGEQNKIVFPDLYRPEQIEILTSLNSSINVVGNYGSVKLTLREIEILRMVCRGLTMKEISKLLNRSPRTVETHANKLKNKLGYSRKSELIALATQNNILI